MLGPIAVDYVATTNKVSVEQAGVLLKDALLDGHLKAEGPSGKIGQDFWRYAAISPDGRAISIRTLTHHDWFEGGGTGGAGAVAATRRMVESAAIHR